MLNFGGWQIDPDVLDQFPEAIATFENILPIAIRGRHLVIVTHDRGEQMDYLIDKMEFILNRDIVYRIAEDEVVRKAVHHFYALRPVRVTHCLHPTTLCSRLWLELAELSVHWKRPCDECGRFVYLCQTEDQAAHHVAQDQCAAVFTPEPNP